MKRQLLDKRNQLSIDARVRGPIRELVQDLAIILDLASSQVVQHSNNIEGILFGVHVR